ncbi:hypothetical protein ARAM_001972 [Aspergillus rambellii]|uniref:Uncharacterized protein n=1 Tax=Aspergillus rambellii TaxID=308745 RepID=A0A0F8VMU7_9EURO|nr:hypothetical protein ARAM_001972 [Aspergillus rambellii]
MELLAEELEFTVEDYRMTLTTARYETEYDRVLARTAQLLDTEHNRIQCMEQLLLQIENESLRLRLDQKNQELVRVIKAESDTRLQLVDTSKELDRLQGVIQVSSREIDNLHRELASSDGASLQSKTLQVENIRLSKDLSNAQLEVERLNSQNTSYQTLLGEKQALTRQLNTLEVQLENEKRAHERTLAKGSQQMEEISSLSSKLEEIRRELEITRRQKGAGHLNNREIVAQQMTTDDTVEGVRKKAVPLEGRHEEASQDYQGRQEAWGIGKQKSFTGKTSVVPLQKPATRPQSELTIATPGAVQAQEQQKRHTTLPGAISSFSITPFLNRTTGLQDSTMSSDDELDELQTVGQNIQQIDLPGGNEQSQRATTQFLQLKSPVARQIYKTGNQGASKTGQEGKGRNGKKPRLLDSPPTGDVDGHAIFQSRLAGQKPAPSRKRKLGLQRDRSLFEEEEEEDMIALQDTKKPGRKLAGTGQTNVSGNRVFTSLGGFSPLKRDKKRP